MNKTYVSAGLGIAIFFIGIWLFPDVQFNYIVLASLLLPICVYLFWDYMENRGVIPREIIPMRQCFDEFLKSKDAEMCPPITYKNTRRHTLINGDVWCLFVMNKEEGGKFTLPSFLLLDAVKDSKVRYLGFVDVETVLCMNKLKRPVKVMKGRDIEIEALEMLQTIPREYLPLLVPPTAEGSAG